MADISIDPIGSGTATAEENTLALEFDLEPSGYYKYRVDGEWLKLEAFPNQGFKFSHFSWKHYADGEFYLTLTSNDNPTQAPSDGSFYFKQPSSPCSAIGREIGGINPPAVFNYSDIVAHFVRVKATVSTSVVPKDGGNVEGGGEFDIGATCTLLASRSDGYELMRLVNEEDGITITPQNPPQCFGKTITHSFSVTKDSSWVAYFRECTNAILRGKSGLILRGQCEKILRDY